MFIHNNFQLVDHLRKPTGGKLEVRLRIRTPLLKPDVITKTEKWLIIDEFNVNNSSFTSLQSTTQASTSASVTPIRNTLQSDPLAATPKTPQQQTPIKPKVTSTPKPPVPPSTPIPVKSETPSQISTPVSTPHRTVAAATPSTISTGGEQSELEQAEEQLNK